jgi:hypothetical protein
MRGESLQQRRGSLTVSGRLRRLPSSGHGGRARAVLGIALVAVVLARPNAGAAGQWSLEPGGPSPVVDAPEVSLSGPFGRLDGYPIRADAPLPDPSLLRPLDAYGRGATITVAPRDARLLLATWRLGAAAEPPSDVAVLEELSAVEDAPSELAFATVPATGVWLVRLDASLTGVDDPYGEPRYTGSWVWRLVVPDREVPGDDIPYPPVPGITLASGQASVAMELGSGCHGGTCSDIGHPSPADQLPTLETAPGAPLVISLDDGTGLAGWVVRATPLRGSESDATELAADTLGQSRAHAVFAAPPSGQWVLEANVRFDLERGGYTAYAGVLVP